MNVFCAGCSIVVVGYRLKILSRLATVSDEDAYYSYKGRVRAWQTLS